MANVAEYFGSLVFDDKTMKERLDPKIYKQLRKTMTALSRPPPTAE